MRTPIDPVQGAAVKRLSVRVTDTELGWLDERAQSLGLDRSTYLRSLVYDDTGHEADEMVELVEPAQQWVFRERHPLPSHAQHFATKWQARRLDEDGVERGRWRRVYRDQNGRPFTEPTTGSERDYLELP